MTQDVKRGRGRPKGSGKLDMPTLRQMAELLTADPKLKPTTVIKRLIGVKSDSDIRRLQVKWKAEGEKLLTEARQRRERRSARQIPNIGTYMIHPSPELRRAITEAQRPMQAAREALEALNLRSVIQAAKEAQRPIQAAREALEALRPTPVMQAAIEALRPSRAMWGQTDDLSKLAGGE